MMPEKVKPIATDLDSILTALDIPKHLLGRKYLHYSIILALTDPKLFRNQAEAYRFVAAHFQRSDSAIQSGIQRATACFWESNNLEPMTAFYRHNWCVHCTIPTDFEFIKYMASYLRTKHNYS